MTINDICAGLDAEIIQNEFKNIDVKGVYTSDLLSDVIANGREADVLVTVQAHRNTIAVATMMNIRCVIVCNSRPIPDGMLSAARNEGIAILRTIKNQFNVSGNLYELLRKN